MNSAPAALPVDSWMDLATAADHAGVSYCTLVDAVTARFIRATTTLPQHEGDWMVPLAHVEAWAQQAVNGRAPAGTAVLSSLA